MKTTTGAFASRCYIERREDFMTQSRVMHGNWIDGSYYVWSYSTVIAQYTDGVWYINDTKYSSFTGAHQNVVGAALGWYNWKYNSIHVNPYFRGVTDLVLYVHGNVAKQRADRIRKENKSYTGLTRLTSV
jgi:hypothetical protein